MIRRRDLMLIPALAMRAAAAPGAVVFHRLRLNGPEPLRELERRWSYGAAARIMVRPAAGWWPVAGVLPDRWQAWVDLPGGGAVHVVARGVSSAWPLDGVAGAVGRLLAG